MDDTTVKIIHYVINPIAYLIAYLLILRRAKVVNIHSAFLASFAVLIYVGSYQVYLNGNSGHRFLFTVWLVPYVYMISLPISFALTGHNASSIQNSSTKDIKINRNIGLFVGINFLITILIPVVYVIDKGFSNIALFFLVTNPGSATESMILRIDSLQSNISPVLTAIYSYGRSIYLPFVVGAFTVLVAKKRIKPIIYAVTIFSSALFCFFSAAKAPLAILIISIILSLYFTNKGRIPRILGTILISSSLLIPSIIYPLMSGARGIDGFYVAITSLVERLIVIPNFAAELYFQAFNSIHEYTGLSSNRLISALLGIDYISVPALIYDYYLKTSISGGLVNAAYFASLYADWGPFGPIIGTFFIAITCHLIQSFLDRDETTHASIAVKSVVIIAVTQLMLADFFSTANGRGMLTLPIILYVANLISRSRRKI